MTDCMGIIKEADDNGEEVVQGKLSWLILGLHPANERCCYKVTLSLIGLVQT